MIRVVMMWMLGVAVPRMSLAADVGSGFGESALVMTSARQAGTGGVAVEDPWRQGRILEASTVVYSPGARWYGIAAQGGLGPVLRLGLEGYLFQGPLIDRTSELSDGSWGGVTGTLRPQEYGGRLTAQWSVVSIASWRLAAVGRVIGLVQPVSTGSNLGGAAEIGGQAQWLSSGAGAASAWALGGPLGVGAGRTAAWRVILGGGWVQPMRTGPLTGAPEGFAVGVETEYLGEALVHGGAGGVYWRGDLEARGAACFLRLGARAADGSAQAARMHGGLGLRWRFASGTALQFDWAISPLGALGLVNVATLGVRL